MDRAQALKVTRLYIGLYCNYEIVSYSDTREYIVKIFPHENYYNRPMDKYFKYFKHAYDYVQEMLPVEVKNYE